MAKQQEQPRERHQDQQQPRQGLAVAEKRETASREERTVPGRFYAPPADVWETEEALVVAMEVPGVAREAVEVEVKEDVLRVEARIDPAKYGGLEPVYTEYGVGHWARAFALSDRVDRERIEARLEDGVLTLTLPKTAAARPRRIPVG
jgi:HSP20 family molecular chaperone IbpA